MFLKLGFAQVITAHRALLDLITSPASQSHVRHGNKWGPIFIITSVVVSLIHPLIIHYLNDCLIIVNMMPWHNIQWTCSQIIYHWKKHICKYVTLIMIKIGGGGGAIYSKNLIILIDVRLIKNKENLLYILINGYIYNPFTFVDNW